MYVYIYIYIYLKSKRNFIHFDRFTRFSRSIPNIILKFSKINQHHMKLIQNLSKSMKFHQNPSNSLNHTKSYSNQSKSIQIHQNQFKSYVHA